MDGVPLSIALVAGGLATLNPCAFPLLPAFLSIYVAADEERLPTAPSRIAQGLLVGLLVAAGFLALFEAIAVPITYGATVVADAVPWAGLTIGALLTLLGAATLLGQTIPVPRLPGVRVDRRRRRLSVFLFGCAYGISSLGCTLPVFLAVIGASVSADGTAASLVVLGAYGAGMGMVLMALSVTAALLRDGLARWLRSVSRRMHRIAGALLVLSGAYLSYYWARFEFGPSATLADDPVIGPMTRYTGRVAVFAQEHATAVLAVAAIIVVAAIAAGARGRHRHHSAELV